MESKPFHIYSTYAQTTPHPTHNPPPRRHHRPHARHLFQDRFS